jgi:uncharacterized protein (DUF362 family)
VERRDFIKQSFLFMAGISLSGLFRGNVKSLGAQEGNSAEIKIAKGKGGENLVYKLFAGAGGISRFVKKGSRVVIKPNIAWNRTPEQAADTNPEVVSGLVKLCKEAGAAEVIVTDHPCNPWKATYVTSGIQTAVEKAGGKMKPPSRYRKIKLSGTQVLKEAEVLEDVLDADVLINVPVVKVHGGAKVTISMKNLMGVVKDRGFFHRTDLHRCIAEIAYYIRPHITVLDATRILTTRGPQGPGVVKEPGMVITGSDFVALDAYGARMLGIEAEEVPHIRIASEMGLGTYNLKKVKIRYV